MAFRDNLYSLVSVKSGLSLPVSKQAVDAVIAVLEARLPANTNSVVEAVLNSNNGVLTQDQLTALGAGILSAEAAGSPQVLDAATKVTEVAQIAGAVGALAQDLSQVAKPAPAAPAPAAVPVPAPAAAPAAAAPAPAAVPAAQPAPTPAAAPAPAAVPAAQPAPTPAAAPAPAPVLPAPVAEVLAAQPAPVQSAASAVTGAVSVWQRFLNYWKS